MKVVNLEKKEKNLTVLTIEVDAETFEQAISRTYRRKVSTLNIPGFRKGKAPRRVVEGMYGKGVFYEDAINATYHDAYDEAVRQEGLTPVEPPDVEIQNIGAEGYTFTATFHVYPAVELGDYKSVKLAMPEVESNEAEVDAEIQRLQERNASLVTAERPAAMGDTVILDYAGHIGDDYFEGGSSEHFSLELGSGRFIPGFEEQLVGANAGEEKSVSLTFPQEYHAPHLAGKDVVFDCKIHEVKEKLKPEADDEFAKDVSEFDSLEEFKASLREKSLLAAKDRAELDYEDALLTQLIEIFQCDVPECMVQTRRENLLDDLENRMRQNHMDLDLYCRLTGQTEESITEEYNTIALRQVQASLIFDEIARLEALSPTEEEVEAEYGRLAELYKRDVAEIQKFVNRENLIQDMSALKASKFIRDIALANAAG